MKVMILAVLLVFIGIIGWALIWLKLKGRARKRYVQLDREARYDKAREIAIATTNDARLLMGKSHPTFAKNLNNLATLHFAEGDYAAAEALLQQTLEIIGKSLGEEHPDFAPSLNNLANLYRVIGDYDAAEPLCHMVMENYRKTVGEEHPDFALSLNNLAMVHYAKGNYTAGEPLLQQALAIYGRTIGKEHPNFGLSLNNLALLYCAKGNYEAAEPLLQQTMENNRKELGERHPNFARSLNNLAWLYRLRGNYGAAEPLFRRAIEIWGKSLGEGHPDYGESSENLAVLYVATGREYEALTLLNAVTATNDHMISQIFSIGSERQRMAFLKVMAAKQALFLTLVSQHLSNYAEAVRAAFELVLRRKAIGAEALAVQQEKVLGGKYPGLEPKLRELATLRMKVAETTLAGPGSEDLQIYKQRLVEWQSQKESLEGELARRIPEMNLEQKLRTVSLQAVALALPVDTSLIEFVRFNLFDFKAAPARGDSQWKSAHYLAFVLPTQETNELKMIDLGDAESIDRLIAIFLEAITIDDESSKRDLGALRNKSNRNPVIRNDTALRAALFDPIISAIGRRTRLLLAPDGDLNRLPFEVLPHDDGRRLIDDYQISYVNTGRDVLRFSAQSSGQPTDPVVAADPNFDLSAAQSVPQDSGETAALRRTSRDLDLRQLRFDPLPGTKVEGERIAKMLNVKPWLGDQALESRLKACNSPYVLHLATHGFFLGDLQRDPNTESHQFDGIGWLASATSAWMLGPGVENPLLRSGLALAGANTWLKKGDLLAEAEDGLLTAEDVSGMDLLATELVVLSACESGLGEIRTGEGVFGLRRAFVLAGAKTLVMSLWRVPDVQTQELMGDFYQRILRGESRAKALRNSQLAMKNKYPHPFYWGAFICQGDPGRLGPIDSGL